MLDEDPGPMARAMLIAKAATALSDILESLREIERIAQAQSEP